MRLLALLLAISLFVSCNNDDGPAEDLSLFPQPVDVTGVLYDSFQGENLVVYANGQKSVMVAFERPSDNGSLRDFTTVENEFPTILEDEFGTRYDVFGKVVSGNGQDLNKSDGFMGFWFSIAAFYATPTLYGEVEQDLIARDQSTTWGVNEDLVFRGAPRDAIPALDVPVFESIDNTTRSEQIFDDTQRVLVVEAPDRHLIFSYSILNWHEIVNGEDFNVNYCPLTGTAFALDKGFGDLAVSGLLFNNNLIMYDRTSETYWSQIFLEGVHGEHLGEGLSKIDYQEMTWSAALEFAQRNQSAFLTDRTGFSRDYNFYPYGNYRSDNETFLYPNERLDTRVPNKELVYSVLKNGRSKVYRFEDFL